MDWQWLAGFTDGDGCIEIKHDEDGLLLQTRVVWFQAEEPSNVLSHIKRFLEKNDVILTERSFYGSDPQTREQTTSIHKQLSVNHEADIEFVLNSLYPYLIVKKAKAKQALTEIESVNQLRKKHGRNWKSYFKHGVGRVAVCTVLMLASLCATVNVARASSLQVLHKPWKQMTKQQKIHVLRKQVQKDNSVIRFWKNHKTLWQIHRYVANKDVHWARVSIHISSKNLHELLSARPSYSSYVGGISHLSFWNCIHSGEGNGHPYTGHPYSGPLQMTSYWAGYPVYDWSTVPISVVYADAEQQLQKHIRAGDVYTWVSGQWPLSHKSCMQHL